MSNYDDNENPKKDSEKKGLKKIFSEIVDAVSEKKYQDSFLPIVTLNECVQYYKDERKKLGNEVIVSGFVVSVRKNFDPRNQNDCFIIVQALVDNQNKPIVFKDETVSRILHTKTIDDALIRALNGEETVIIKA